MEQTAAAQQQAASRSVLDLDPRTKFFVLLGMCLVFTLNAYGLAGYILRGFMLALTVASLVHAGSTRAGVGVATMVLAAFALQEFGETALFALFDSTNVVMSVVRFFCVLVAQFVPQTMYAYSIILSTKVGEFIAAMKRMRVPDAITIPLAVIFRFFPTVGEEYRGIRDAMRLRGLDWRSGPVAMVEYRLVPLIISLVKIGDELASACATRGLGIGAKRTHLCRIGIRSLDVACMLFVGACAAVTVYLRMSGAVL